MAKTINEWQAALENLNGCIATIKCGCIITLDESISADSLYFRCKEYLKAYEDAKYWGTPTRREDDTL